MPRQHVLAWTKSPRRLPLALQGSLAASPSRRRSACPCHQQSRHSHRISTLYRARTATRLSRRRCLSLGSLCVGLRRLHGEDGGTARGGAPTDRVAVQRLHLARFARAEVGMEREYVWPRCRRLLHDRPPRRGRWSRPRRPPALAPPDAAYSPTSPAVASTPGGTASARLPAGRISDFSPAHAAVGGQLDGSRGGEGIVRRVARGRVGRHLADTIRRELCTITPALASRKTRRSPPTACPRREGIISPRCRTVLHPARRCRSHRVRRAYGASVANDFTTGARRLLEWNNRVVRLHAHDDRPR